MGSSACFLAQQLQQPRRVSCQGLFTGAISISGSLCCYAALDMDALCAHGGVLRGTAAAKLNGPMDLQGGSSAAGDSELLDLNALSRLPEVTLPGIRKQ